MKVVLADYGAGNLRSVCSALARAGEQPVVSRTIRQRSPARRSRSSRASGTSPRAAEGLGPLAEVLRDRVAAGRPVFGICVGLQVLFERERRGRRGSRSARRPGVQARRADGSAHGLERARRAPGLRASSTVSTARTSTSPTAMRCSRTTTTSWSPGSTTPARWSPPSRTASSPESSSIPSGAAPPEPACSRTCCDGQEAPDSLPRRRRRPRRQGRALRVAARRRRSGRARPALLGRRRRRARLPGHHRDRRRPRADARARRARRGAADDPVHGRRRDHRISRTLARCSAPGRTRSPSTERRSTIRRC